MTPENFAYWLQGFTELNPSMEQPTPEQWKSITEHLKTVFVKVTPEIEPFKIRINSSGDGEQLAEQIKQIVRDGVRKGPFFGGPWPAPVITC